MRTYPRQIIEIEEVDEDILSAVCQTPEMQQLQAAVRRGLFFREEWWASLSPEMKKAVETNAAIINALKWVDIAKHKVVQLEKRNYEAFGDSIFSFASSMRIVAHQLNEMCETQLLKD